MDNRMDAQNLFEHIKFISAEAAQILRGAVPDGPYILKLTREDLNKFLPGAHYFHHRRHIRGLINMILQEQGRQSVDSSPADVIDIPTSAREDLNELQPGAHVDQVEIHIMGLINAFLQMQAGRSVDSSPADVIKAAPYGPDILTLTKEDLNELLPGEQNFQVRRHIMGLIHVFLQQEKQVRQSMDSIPADVMSHAPEGLKSNDDHTSMDMDEKPMAAQDDKRPNMTNNSELPRNGTDQADFPAKVPQPNVACTDLERKQQQMDVQDANRREIDSDNENPGKGTDPAGHAPEGLKSNDDHTSMGMDEKPMAAQDGKRPNMTNDSQFPRNGTDRADEGRELHQRVFVPAMEHSTGPSGDTSLVSFPGVSSRCRLSLKTLRNYSLVKVHMLVVGETFCTHETFMQKLKLQIEQHNTESSNVILVFCPVVSRIGTDMDAAMARVTVNKPVILVFMHHCHNPSHMTDITVQPSRRNIEQVVHCAFHQYKGLLECQENEQAVKAVHSTLLRYADSHDEVPQSKVPRTQPVMVQQQMAAQGDNRAKITSDNENPGKGTDPAVKVHMLVTGETFSLHETFMQKLKLQIDRDYSEESCNVILVFCPVVSQIGTDMDAAMNRVPDNKPVILVFMHHCHNPSHMTNNTVQPSRSNIVQVVHCAYHETYGLLECQENEQAVKAVRSTLLRCVDVQAEVPPTQSENEQQPVAAQNANGPIITNEVPGTSTKPMTEERESDQKKIVPAKGHSTGPTGGTSLVSKTGRFSFSKPNWNISSETLKFPFSRLNPNPNKLNNSSLVKVHMLVAGETFNTHETFMQKLKLQIELCSAESSNVILVFCPVVSQIGTDMEAAMARVTEDKPVILVFMHHCHNPSHMTNITVQPSRSNIVQVVHCAFHETKALLRCQENDQAVAEVQEKLKKYK